LAVTLLGLALLIAGGLYFAYPTLSAWISGRGTADSDPSLSSPAKEPIASTAPTPLSATSSAQTAPATSALTVGPRVGQLAPDFTLASLQGETVSLSQFRGKVVILDFWASWCVPCRSSMPALHALWRDVEDRGAVLLGVSLDRTAAAATTFLENNGYNDMIALWGSLAAADAVRVRYGVGGIPRTLVIDREGIVRFNDHPAYLKPSTVEPLL